MNEYVVVNTLDCSVEYKSTSFENCEKYLNSCEPERIVFGELTIEKYADYLKVMESG